MNAKDSLRLRNHARGKTPFSVPPKAVQLSTKDKQQLKQLTKKR